MRKSRLKKKDLAEILDLDPKKLEAVKLRTLGWSYHDIAHELSVSSSTASKWVREAHEKYLGKMDDSVEMMIRQSEMQIDWAIKKLTTSIENSPFGEGLARKLEVLVKLMDRRASLRGLDAPKKTQNVNVGVNFSNLTLEELKVEAERLGIKTQPLPVFETLLPGETPLVIESTPSSLPE